MATPRKPGNDGSARELTIAAILKYKPIAKQREISDSKAKGLRLVIQPTGRMSWIVRLRRPDGKSAKLHLGAVDTSDKDSVDEPVPGGALTLWQARQRASEIDRKRARGLDVIAEEKSAALRKRSAAADAVANSFAAAVREFFIDYETRKWQSRPRNWRYDAATLGLRYPIDSDPATTEPEVIKGGLAESWAKKSVTDIDGFAVHTVVDEARKQFNNTRARKLHSGLSTFCTWLQRQQRITINPVAGVWRPGPPRPRERALKPAEIKVFWKACDKIGGPFGALWQLLLLSGCRLREVTGMTRAELGDDGVWEIPSSRVKNHLTFMVPLPPQALDIIASVPQVENHAMASFRCNRAYSKLGLIFTTNGKTPVSGFSKAKKALDAEMTKIAGQPIEPWCVHDLRRSFSTILNESPEDGGLGIAPHIVEALLNHSKPGVARVYNKAAYLSEKRAALARWAVHVEGLVADRKAKVLPMRG
jgi:integrase